MTGCIPISPVSAKAYFDFLQRDLRESLYESPALPLVGQKASLKGSPAWPPSMPSHLGCVQHICRHWVKPSSPVETLWLDEHNGQNTRERSVAGILPFSVGKHIQIRLLH